MNTIAQEKLKHLNISNEKLFDPIYLAIMSNSLDILLECPHLPEALQSHSIHRGINLQVSTPLIYALEITETHSPLIDYLIDHSDLNLTNTDGDSALMVATTMGNFEAVKRLVPKSEHNIKNARGYTARMIALHKAAGAWEATLSGRPPSRPNHCLIIEELVPKSDLEILYPLGHSISESLKSFPHVYQKVMQIKTTLEAQSISETIPDNSTEPKTKIRHGL